MPVPVTRVFLSSTVADLKPYREAVCKAINDIQDYKCVGMEGFGARPETPTQVCVEKVVECDLLVGIVGPLYGSSPPDNPAKSFTEIEYEAAVRAGVPTLMFVTPDDFPVAANLREPHDRELRQGEFRARVRAEETVVSSFNSPQELATSVVASVTNWMQRRLQEREEERASPKPPNPATHVPQTCDRKLQEATFAIFRDSGLQTRPDFPQFYFVHGGERENHKSFVNRLCRTSIQDYAAERSQDEGAKVTLVTAEWPPPREADEALAPALREEMLRHFVFAKGRERLLAADEYKGRAHAAPPEPPAAQRNTGAQTPEAMRKMLMASGSSVVVFQHEIQARDWDEVTDALVRWYLKFWDEVRGDGPAPQEFPQCFIFLNVVYPQSDGPASGALRVLRRANPRRLDRRVERALEGICEPDERAPKVAAPRCPCVLLARLSCVERQHLMDWLSENCPGMGEDEHEVEAHRILTDKRKGPAKWFAKCRNMRDVEPHLKRLHERSGVYARG